jgi:non-homologous end joining protein Ku
MRLACAITTIVVERADLVRGFYHAKDQYVSIIERGIIPLA